MTLPLTGAGPSATVSWLFRITHDADDLSEYDSTETDGGKLSTGTPGLASTTARMEVLIDDADEKYGRIDVSPPSLLRLRIYIDPNTLTMGNAESFSFLRLAQAGGSWWVLGDIHLRYYIATGYQIAVEINDDGESLKVWDTLNISDAEHYIEFYIVRAATAGSTDGTFEWWVDGASQGQTAGCDNYNEMVDANIQLRLGAVAGVDSPGTAGTFYLDEFFANDDGSQIGA